MTSLPIGDIAVLLVIILAYMFLGMFLESMAMLVLTIPVVIPIAIGLDWNLIWLGNIIVIGHEMGMISRSVGINVFIVKSITPGLTESEGLRRTARFDMARAPTVASRSTKREMLPEDLLGTLPYLARPTATFLPGRR